MAIWKQLLGLVTAEGKFVYIYINKWNKFLKIVGRKKSQRQMQQCHQREKEVVKHGILVTSMYTDIPADNEINTS